ncbi:unnamed protein product [Gadus morhua 'NCC']
MFVRVGFDISPNYLHTNSTSHTGPFSAIAELIDNAYDPGVDAEQIWITMTQIREMECLTFRDNGNGLSSDKMLEMLSFGYSDKKAEKGKHPIGIYGNGFKSGSMRLGQDAIILSKSENEECVGMLSQTYLEKILAKQITVPIISTKKPGEKHSGSEMWENRASLSAILEHSPFKTEEELLTELEAIEGPTGTKIIIWNLRRASERNMELDFTKENDIRFPCDDTSDTSVPDYNSSLRAYCSILYLKPKMQINIQGKKVETDPITKGLTNPHKKYYTPKTVKEKIPIIFGDNRSKTKYGLMMYHKNRLIKAYLRVGCQLKAKNRRGVGVIGVIECIYLKTTHNKQDFEDTITYRNTIQNVASKLRDYSGKRRINSRAEAVIEISETSISNTPQTSGEGPSGTKRPRRNCDDGESVTDRVLSNSAAPTLLPQLIPYIDVEKKELQEANSKPNERKTATEGPNREPELKGEAVGEGECQPF